MSYESFNIKQYLNDILDKNIEKAKKYMTDCIPDILIKFYSLLDESDNKNKVKDERKINTLSNNQLWLSNCDSFNDPFEFEGVSIDYNFFIKNNFTKDWIEAINKIDIVTKYMNVFSSFCDCSAISPAMWAHYTNEYKGFYVAYKINKKLNFDRVLYEDNRIQLSKSIIKLLNYNNQNKETYFSQQDTIQCMELLRHRYFIKHSSWKNEREFRICMNVLDKQCNKNLWSFDELGIEIEKIVIGYNCNEANRQRLIDIANKNNKPVYDVKISKTKFELEEKLV